MIVIAQNGSDVIIRISVYDLAEITGEKPQYDSDGRCWAERLIGRTIDISPRWKRLSQFEKSTQSLIPVLQQLAAIQTMLQPIEPVIQAATSAPQEGGAP